MMQYIVFDCYQTLICKKNLEQIVQAFCARTLKKQIPLSCIKNAYKIIYDRYKFSHPRFRTEQQRKKFYTKYNTELLVILGLTISEKQAQILHHDLKKAYWACYPDTHP